MRESPPSVLPAYRARADRHPEEVSLAQISQCGGGLSVVRPDSQVRPHFHGHVTPFFPNLVIAYVLHPQ